MKLVQNIMHTEHTGLSGYTRFLLTGMILTNVIL